ncbi:hypothetical protein F5Y11DRAFT_345479 [Daldinia sp. FL1419]|nr:hypothetical protein F5Y11DRAFT_345479 [Daldinia sp. FL1419]
MGSIKEVILFLLLQAHFINGFSWRSGSKVGIDAKVLINSNTVGDGLPQLLKPESRLPSPYETALRELRELESEPLCHRTAARLLVNNCEVLEGKNDASVLTESGRKIRDFVDSYAASLAICDLERGSFQIPRECANFRESVLNEHILLFQRLTRVMGRFTDDIDKQFERHMKDLDIRAQVTSSKVDKLSPMVDRLKDSLGSVEDFVLSRLMHAVKDTTDAVSSGAQNAVNLQKMLEVVLKSVREGQAEVASSYEHSIQLANQRAESAIETAIQAIAVASVSAGQLQTQIELSRLQAAELESRQNTLEKGMRRLLNITENLAVYYDDHASSLQQARNITNDIFEALEGTAASASRIGNSFLKQSPTLSWWPYIWCPATSLVLGSYGLPPSAMRNLVLLALGEVAGLTISSIHSYAPGMELSALLDTWRNSFSESRAPSNTSSPLGLL